MSSVKNVVVKELDSFFIVIIELLETKMKRNESKSSCNCKLALLWENLTQGLGVLMGIFEHSCRSVL